MVHHREDAIIYKFTIFLKTFQKKSVWFHYLHWSKTEIVCNIEVSYYRTWTYCLRCSTMLKVCPCNIELWSRNKRKLWFVKIRSCKYCLLCIFGLYCLSSNMKSIFKSSVFPIWDCSFARLCLSVSLKCIIFW